MLTITTISSNVAIMGWDSAKVECTPKVKYKVDKANPIDPTQRFRSGKYFEETFKITLYIELEGYTRLKSALLEAEDVWLEYEAGCWRCEVTKYPAQGWELLDATDEVELELQSIYKERESKPRLDMVTIDEVRVG